MGFTPITNNFVGRERELAELIAACESGAESDGHLFLIHGEPGIGKTRLADELASRVKARGMQVLWGRCWDGDGTPAYWPWIQLIRGFLGALDPEQRRNLAVESGTAADIVRQVAQIIPDLRPALSNPHPSVNEKLDPHEARFRLFDALTNFLKMGARFSPMLIVLDDLHDADEASLALLHFVARELRGTPIFILATYRDLEVRTSPSLSKHIGELGREARSIPLGGLRASEVTQLVELRAGQTPDARLVAKLCAATNGNPLFVDGIVRTLIAEGAIGSVGSLDRPFKIPSGVGEAIRDRLAHLSAATNAILATAAAFGNEFELNFLGNVADVSVERTRVLLDESSRAGIVAPLGDGRYRFSHALVRSALYDELDSNSRIRIHGEIAKRLEETYRADIEPHLAEVAHHFREAQVVEKALEYSLRTGRAACSVMAFTDAVTHWQAALELMEQHGEDAWRRAELLGLLGDASYGAYAAVPTRYLAFRDDRERSVQYRESAIALFESIGCIEEAARIRVSLARSLANPESPVANGPRSIEHLRRAESVLVKGPDTFELASVYAGIANYEQLRLNLVQCSVAARRAMEISDRIGANLVWTTAAGFEGYVLAASGKLKEAFALFDRAFDVADQTNTPGIGKALASTAGGCCMWLGDPRAARAWYEREINRPRNARYQQVSRLLSAAVADTYSEEGQIGEVIRRSGPEDPGVRFWVRGEWEVFAELESMTEALERADNRITHIALSSFWLGPFYLYFTREYARAEAHVKYGLDNGDRGPLIMHEMRDRPFLALVYVGMRRLEDAEAQLARCRQIMAAGEDWRGRASTVVWAEAVVAAARGNYDLAERHFESALAIQRNYHLMNDECLMLHDWGRALVAADHRTQAAEKFDAAIELNRAHGVGPRFIEHVMADKMRALKAQTTPIATGTVKPQQTEAKVTGAFRREGEFWTISYDATTFRLKDSKGLHYLAYLLSRPGQRIHVYDLIEAVEGSAANRKTTIYTESEGVEIVREIGGSTPTLDSRARSEYGARLRDLHCELDEAERMNDLGRSERLRTEIEVVGQELTGVSGLGDRTRAASVSAERARGVVRKNIGAVVAKIRREHPALGRHLAASIGMGYFCIYQPEHSVSWQF